MHQLNLLYSLILIMTVIVILLNNTLRLSTQPEIPDVFISGSDFDTWTRCQFVQWQMSTVALIVQWLYPIFREEFAQTTLWKILKITLLLFDNTRPSSYVLHQHRYWSSVLDRRSFSSEFTSDQGPVLHGATQGTLLQGLLLSGFSPLQYLLCTERLVPSWRNCTQRTVRIW